jgi:iron complex transport system substrate-binding protein
VTKLRWLAPAAALLLALTACGTGSNAGDGQGGTEAETRTIVHAMGKTEVPVQPKRVIVLDTDKLDTAVTLGVVPVGAANTDESDGWPKYLGDAVKDVQQVGTLQEPNLEAIAKLDPDLILGSAFRQKDYYAKLNAIAPTVFTELVGTPWKENFLLDGQALGKEQEAKDLLAKYEQRAKDVGKSLGDPSKTEVSIVRFRPTEIRLYGPTSFVGIVIGDVGLARPKLQRLEGAKDRRFTAISPERIGEADGDVIFVTAFGAEAAKSQAEVTGGALWRQLGAVKAGRAYEVPDETWMTGIGITAANKVLDDLERHLAPAS